MKGVVGAVLSINSSLGQGKVRNKLVKWTYSLTRQRRIDRRKRETKNEEKVGVEDEKIHNYGHLSLGRGLRGRRGFG